MNDTTGLPYPPLLRCFRAAKDLAAGVDRDDLRAELAAETGLGAAAIDRQMGGGLRALRLIARAEQRRRDTPPAADPDDRWYLARSHRLGRVLTTGDCDPDGSARWARDIGDPEETVEGMAALDHLKLAEIEGVPPRRALLSTCVGFLHGGRREP